MKPSYLFYDLETTGLSKPFDQIVQFAAIRTDLELNEIERIEFLIRLNPDVIPSPYAQITHRTSLKRVAEGVSEPEAIEKIHAIINEPGTISLGYNTLGFDDEFLRFSFYRNLLPPYTHQFANGCTRMDLYPMAIFYHLFKPDVVKWPKIDGRVSLKLEHLSAANQLATGAAHNAMVDVEATLTLAKKFQQHDKMWDYLCQFFDKSEDSRRIAQLEHVIPHHAYGVYVEGVMGKKANFTAPVLGLGNHKHYKNQSLWLRLDLPELLTASADDFIDHSWVIHKKFGEPGFLLPANPRYLAPISTERMSIVEKNIEKLTENPACLTAITQHYRDYKYPNQKGVDGDAKLYMEGFMSNSDQQWCQQFHDAALANKSQLINDMRQPSLHDKAIRVLGRMDINLLDAPQQENFNAYLNDVRGNVIFKDYKGGTKLTPAQACEQILALQKDTSLDDEQQDLLVELGEYLEEILM